MNEFERNPINSDCLFFTSRQVKQALAKDQNGPGSAGVLACPRPEQPTLPSLLAERDTGRRGRLRSQDRRAFLQEPLKHIRQSDLLSENRCLAPSDSLRWREPVMVNDPEMTFCLTDDFAWWMTLE